VTSDEWRVTGKSPASGGDRVTGHRSPVTCLARIELGPAEIPRFLADGLSVKVTEVLKGIGYAHVTLDLEGYRRGGDAMRPKRD